PLRMLSLDIETQVPLDNSFLQYHTTAELPVIQIGSIIEECRQGIHFQKRNTFRSIFTLGQCSKIPGAEVHCFSDESALLLAWMQFIIGSDPDLTTGYNIARFDFVYLLLRAEALSLPGFSCLGRLKGCSKVAPRLNEQRAWKDAPILAGRLQIDIFQYVVEKDVRDGLPPRSYKLENISQDFLEEKKEDLNFRVINKLQAGSDDDRKKLAVYCLKDTYLPLRLLD
ncbi:ribonuclease H-like domain-containing protein, partial [Mycena crocata]